MKKITVQDVKIKMKRLSKGVRSHIRRMKQAARKESLPSVLKK